MMLDLDRFRAVNEALGIAAGDALLAVTGARLEQALGPGDRLLPPRGRPLRHRRPPRPGRSCARWRTGCCRRSASRWSLDGRTVVMQASIGIVAADRRGAADRGAADAGRHRAPPRQGRGPRPLRAARAGRRTRGAREQPARARPRRRARRTARCTSSTSPTSTSRDGRVSGVEALLRWRHPTRGELQPAAFIPLAEATGHDPAARPLGAPHRAGAAARWPARLGARGQHLAAAVPPAGLPRRGRRRARRRPASRPSGSSSRSPRPC